MRRLSATLAGVEMILAVVSVAAAASGALCTADPSVNDVIAGVFLADPSCDVNGDGVVASSDVTAAAQYAPDPICPDEGAAADILVDRRSGLTTARAVLRGDLLTPSCRSSTLTQTYEIDLECDDPDGTACAQLDGLQPGVWLQRFVSNATGALQIQHRKVLLTADTVATPLRFVLFADVFVVTNTANAGNGSLRQALQLAPALAKPLLIRFDDLVFPAGTPTVIALDFPLTRLDADDVTIDALDALGEPANRVVDARGLPFGALSITGGRNHIIGLRLRNAGSGNRDVVQISGAGAFGNVLEQCVIENASSGDGVGIDDMAGTNLGEGANVVRQCEISDAADKGVKVTTGSYARVESSWVHGNANGGVQATLGGNVTTIENVIEDNFGSTAENGIAVQGFDPSFGASRMVSEGDMILRNGASGVAVRGFAIGRVHNGYLARNQSSGMRVFNDVGSPAVASADGTTFACNAADGATVANGSIFDLGGGELGSSGNNALTRSDLSAGGVNLRNATANVVGAFNNQWEHCGDGLTCNNTSIAALDLSDGGLLTSFTPAQPQRGLGPPIVERVSPSKGRAGEQLRIYGLRFNAIDGHAAQGACVDVATSNTCSPLRGNCVRIGGVAAAVEAVTPRMLVVRWPYTCIEPVPLVVTSERAGTGATSQSFMVCTDASEVSGN